MNLAPGERILLRSDTGDFVLTSQRARYSTSASGRGEVVSIMLESITSCRMIHGSKPWLLVAAAVFGVIGLLGISDGGGLLGFAFVMALLSFGLYYGSRYQAIQITSPSAEIKLNTQGMSVQSATTFIDKVEAAKAERLNEIRHQRYAEPPAAGLPRSWTAVGLGTPARRPMASVPVLSR